jgi:DNA-binding XRE family transcriptional regulator
MTIFTGPDAPEPMAHTELRAIQERAGIAAVAMASWLGVARRTLTDYRSGQQRIPGPVARALRGYSPGPPLPQMSAAEFLRAQRESGFTGTDMAVWLGVSRRSIVHYRAGRLAVPGPVARALWVGAGGGKAASVGSQGGSGVDGVEDV